MNKVVNQIFFKLLSEDCEPVNLFRFVECMYTWMKDPIDTVFKLIDINDTGELTT